jgi:DNA polymerase elongation subunit (family B)
VLESLPVTDTFFDIETTGLNPFQDQILTIQVKRDELVCVWKLWDEVDEENVIRRFLDFLEGLRAGEAIFGYNILTFDIPFIWARLSLLSEVDADLYHRFFNRNWKDIYQYFGESYCSIDYWLERFNIKRGCVYTGKDVPQLFREEKYEAIEAHAIDDLIVSEKLVGKLRSHGSESS